MWNTDSNFRDLKKGNLISFFDGKDSLKKHALVVNPIVSEKNEISMIILDRCNRAGLTSTTSWWTVSFINISYIGSINVLE